MDGGTLSLQRLPWQWDWRGWRRFWLTAKGNLSVQQIVLYGVKDPRKASPACVAFFLLLAGCPQQDPQTEKHSAERRPPPTGSTTSPTPGTVPHDRPRCALGKLSRSPRAAVVFLVKQARLPRVVFVPAERAIGPAGQKAPLRAALQQLTRGTTAREKRAGCASYFDSASPAALRGVALEGDEATIDFNGEAMFALGATAATSMFLGQLRRTVFRFPQINSVRLKLDGSCNKFGEAVQTLRCVILRRKP